MWQFWLCFSFVCPYIISSVVYALDATFGVTSRSSREVEALNFSNQTILLWKVLIPLPERGVATTAITDVWCGVWPTHSQSVVADDTRVDHPPVLWIYRDNDSIPDSNCLKNCPYYLCFIQVCSARAWYRSGAIFHRSAIFSTIRSDTSLSLFLLLNMNSIIWSWACLGIIYFSSIPARHIWRIRSILSRIESMVRSR